MKKNKKITAAILFVVAVTAVSTAVNAQSYSANKTGDSIFSSHYENAKIRVRHGNNCAKLSTYGIYDINDKQFGAGADLYWFQYGCQYGLSGTYLKGRSAVNAFVGYRFTGPQSVIHFETNLGVGLAEQWSITGSAGNFDEKEFSGNYVMLLASSKMRFSANAEARVVARLSKNFEIFGSVKGVYLPFEGSYNDADMVLDLESNDGRPVMIIQSSAEESSNMLLGELQKIHVQAAIGFSLHF